MKSLTASPSLDIPQFKEVVVMATNCEVCGNRTSEIKSGSGISEFGTRIVLKVTDKADLSRDILKVFLVIRAGNKC